MPAKTDHAIENQESRIRNLLPLTLIVFVLPLYGRALTADFVFDDEASVINNPTIRRLSPLGSALWAPDENPIAGRPLVNLSLALNYRFGGMNPSGYRLFNLAVHVGCAVMLFLVVRRTLRAMQPSFEGAEDGLAWAVALIWVVHPVQTECVNYITQRTESMAALCILSGLYFAARALTGPRPVGWAVAASVACWLGAACKEIVVTAPVLIALYAFFCLPAGARRRGRSWPLWLGLVLTWPVLGLFMLSGPRSDTVGFGLGIGAWQYFLNQADAVAGYIRLVVWPHPLLIDYGIPVKIGLADVRVQATVVVLALIATGVALWRWPRAGFCGAWFFVLLAPTSTFVPIISEVAAERRMYLALAGPVALVIIGGFDLWRRLVAEPDRAAPRRVAIAATCVACIAILALSVRTFARNVAYRDPPALWRSAIEWKPGNVRAYNNLGQVLYGRDLEQAIRCFTLALEMAPENVDAQYNLGRSYQALNRLEDAEAAYRRAIEIKPDHARAHNNLGTVLILGGDAASGEEAVRRAMQIDPRYGAPHNNLGNLLREQGHLDKAMEHFRRALDLDGPSAEVYYNLGLSLAMSGRLQEAVEQYRRGLRLRPDSIRTLNNLGVTLMMLDQPTVAQSYFMQALQYGESPQVHTNLGDVLAIQGRREDAIRHYRRALELDPGFARAREHLEEVEGSP
ncbi:MAG: hypothetical protein CMJ18_24175 [Phycisphaeraceae bacterium]|nr:hypothetical protein [Phycisphaeraceae bacterium]